MGAIGFAGKAIAPMGRSYGPSPSRGGLGGDGLSHGRGEARAIAGAGSDLWGLVGAHLGATPARFRGAGSRPSALLRGG